MDARSVAKELSRVGGSALNVSRKTFGLFEGISEQLLIHKAGSNTDIDAQYFSNIRYFKVLKTGNFIIKILSLELLSVLSFVS